MWLLWVLVALAALGASGLLVFGVMVAQGSPQEAAIAAIAVGCAVIPYVFVRAVAEIGAERRMRRAVLEALRASRDETLARLKPPPGG